MCLFALHNFEINNNNEVMSDANGLPTLPQCHRCSFSVTTTFTHRMFVRTKKPNVYMIY